MKKIILSLFIPIFAFANGDKPIPAPGPKATEQRHFADMKSKELAKKIQMKTQEIAQSVREKAKFTGVEFAVNGGLDDLIAWLKQEVGEAYNVGADFRDFVASAKIVFSRACDVDVVAYSHAWSRFLSISLKYAAALGCAFYEPIFLPPVCYVVGHIVGKYAGAALGKLIHNASCGSQMRDLTLAELNRAVDTVDPYLTAEWAVYSEVVTGN